MILVRNYYIIYTSTRTSLMQEDPLEKERIEDWVIAHTWRRYIESEEEVPDREMILQFPMVKVRTLRNFWIFFRVDRGIPYLC